MSKPLQPIDEQAVENYARLGAGDADIATMTGLSIRAVNRRWGGAIARIRAERRTRIRKLIWAAVMEGNATLLIWLGKVELGWAESSAPQSHLEPRPKKRFDFDAYAAEFARLHGAGAVTDGDPHD